MWSFNGLRLNHRWSFNRWCLEDNMWSFNGLRLNVVHMEVVEVGLLESFR